MRKLINNNIKSTITPAVLSQADVTPTRSSSTEVLLNKNTFLFFFCTIRAFKYSKLYADHNVLIYLLAVVVLADNAISSRMCLERAA